MSGPYDDIIHLPHPVSATHPQMSAVNRAAQFSPFAALTGFESAIKETARLTDEQIALGENAIADLEMKLNILADSIADHPEVSVTYFKPDDKKKGGAYLMADGAVKRIDEYEGMIVLMDGRKLAIKDVLDINSELFEDLC